MSGQSLSLGTGQLSSFTNNGTAQATGGGTLTVSPTTLTNFSAPTLTGGTWRAASGGTLRLAGVNIATNAAAIVLDGTTSNVYNA